MEKVKEMLMKTWEERPWLLYIAFLLLLLGACKLYVFLYRPFSGHITRPPVQQAVQGQPAPAQQQAKKAPGLQYVVVSHSEQVAVFDLKDTTDEERTTVGGGYYTTGLVIIGKEVRRDIGIGAGPNSVYYSPVIDIAVPGVAKKAVFKLGNLKPGNDTQVPTTTIAFYVNGEKRFEKSVSKENLIFRDIPVEIDVSGVDKLRVCLSVDQKEAAPMKTLYARPAAFVLGDLQFAGE